MRSTLLCHISQLKKRLIFFRRSFDVDLPVEVDDEYWEHPDPSQRFQQPPGKPSVITYFVLQIKLMRILSFCLRTIVRVYSLMLFFRI